MEVLEVCTKLKNLRISNVNSGGCAIIMLSIYRKLKKENSLKGNECFVYLYPAYLSTSYEKNEKFREGKIEKPTSCGHAAFMQNGKLYDVTGEISPEYLHRKQFIPIEEEITFVVNSINEPNWNCLFERGTQIPKIEKGLKIDLGDILKF